MPTLQEKQELYLVHLVRTVAWLGDLILAGRMGGDLGVRTFEPSLILPDDNTSY